MARRSTALEQPPLLAPGDRIEDLRHVEPRVADPDGVGGLDDLAALARQTLQLALGGSTLTANDQG